MTATAYAPGNATTDAISHATASRALRSFRVPFRAMASACEVVLAAPDERQAQAWAGAAIEEVARIETKYSRYRADSIVSRINAAAGGRAVDCDDETWALINHAQTLFDSSGGLFDITSGVLRQAWDFKRAQLPDNAVLERTKKLIGWVHVERSAQRLRLPEPGMEIDFGGFGKEYAADRAASLMAAQGAQHGYVNLAGDIRVIGPKADGQPWLIGIQHPRDPTRLVASLPVSQGGLATSGDYERYFDLDGRRYCHVLDPSSGQPVTHWQSISVLAPLAVLAGNCSTIAMLKQAQGLAFLNDCGWSYLAIDHSGALHMNDASTVAARSASAA